MELRRYEDSWTEDDPHANFKAEVALYTRNDPMPMMVNLSKLTGIPVGSLIRYVLVKYGSEGTEVILHAGPRLVRRMSSICEEAALANSTEARLEAFESLRQIIGWLQFPLEGPSRDDNS